MERVDFTVQKRTTFRKGPSRQLRIQGKIPGVVYGHGLESIPIVVDKKEFAAVIRHHIGRNFMLNLLIDGTDESHERWVIIRDLQKDPITDDFIHVDLYELKRGEPIHVTVPIRLEGSPVGVKAGGHLESNLREVEVKCLPKDIPEYIEVNIDHLKIGGAIHISDLEIGNVEFMSDSHLVIASVIAARGTAEDMEEKEEEITEPEVVGGKGKSDGE